MDFTVGDKVRINHQQHPFCGFYGVITEAPEGSELLTIESDKQMDLINPDKKVKVNVFRSQVEQA